MSVAALTTRPELGRDEPPELIARISRGEAGSFEELIRLFHSRVTRLAHRLLGWDGDVEDVVQDVFVAALQKAGSFKGNCSLWTWLTVITLNRCRTHRRRRKVIARMIEFLSRRAHGESGAADRPVLAHPAQPDALARVDEARNRTALILLRQADRAANDPETRNQASELYLRTVHLFPAAPAGRVAAERLKST